MPRIELGPEPDPHVHSTMVEVGRAEATEATFGWRARACAGTAPA